MKISLARAAVIDDKEKEAPLADELGLPLDPGQGMIGSCGLAASPQSDCTGHDAHDVEGQTHEKLIAAGALKPARPAYFGAILMWLTM